MEYYLICFAVLSFAWKITSKLLDFRFVKGLSKEKLQILGKHYPDFFNKPKRSILSGQKTRKNPTSPKGLGE
jgi:hypothetical protein